MTSSGLSGVATAASGTGGGAKRSKEDRVSGQTTIINSTGKDGEKEK